MNVMVITHGSFSQHQTITTNLHLFFRWKTHRWHPCTLVPDSVQQGMKGASESCGKGLEMRGKKFVSCKRVNSLGMLLYPPVVALPLSYIECCAHIWMCSLLWALLCSFALYSVWSVNAACRNSRCDYDRMEVKAVKHHIQCKRNSLPLGHRCIKKEKHISKLFNLQSCFVLVMLVI